MCESRSCRCVKTRRVRIAVVSLRLPDTTAGSAIRIPSTYNDASIGATPSTHLSFCLLVGGNNLFRFPNRKTWIFQSARELETNPLPYCQRTERGHCTGTRRCRDDKSDDGFATATTNRGVAGVSTDHLLRRRWRVRRNVDMPGVGITVGATAAAGTGVVVVEGTGATPVVTGDGIPSVSAAETGEGVGGWANATGDGVPPDSAAETGEGVGGWANAVGSAVGGVGGLVGESAGSGAGTGTDVCGGVGWGVSVVDDGVVSQPHATLKSDSMPPKVASVASSKSSIPGRKQA